MYADYVNIPCQSGSICTAIMKVGIATAVGKVLFATMGITTNRYIYCPIFLKIA